MLFGAHVSVARSLIAGLEYAGSVGAECMQVFAKSPRQWVGPANDPTAVGAFLKRRAQVGFGPVFTHTAYLLNLSSVDDDLREKSVAALADELVRGAVLGADGVVTHIGNDRAADPAAAAARTADSLRRAFDAAGGRASGVRLLLENTAGAGAAFGASVEEIARCIDLSGMPSDRLGVCLDTCHAFAFGYGLDTPEGCRDLLGRIDSEMGLDRLGLLHLNDCMFGRGAKRDRHAWIGDGEIGYAGFGALVCDPRLAAVPAVTEMPGEAPEKDVTNMERLKTLRGDCRSLPR